MADTKITALTALTAADPANDVLPIVDVSDTTMAASGTTKKISVNNILGASGTATLASATITGDLTVDTNVLKVDTVNNRVGVNTASPLTNLHVGSGAGLTGLGIGLSRGATANFFEAFDGTKTFIGGTDSANAGVKVGSLSNHSVFLVCNNITQLQIDPLGVFSFTDGAGGTRMTLNSTGLGVGTSPATGVKLDVNGFVRGTSGAVFQGANNISSGAGLELGYSTGSQYGFLQSFDRSGAAYKPIRLIGSSIDFDIANSVKATIDTSGNVGIGVTPSAWASGLKALQVANTGSYWFGGGTAWSANNYNYFGNNGYNDGTNWLYTRAYGAAQYEQYNNEHRWKVSTNSPSAGGAITFSQAMTLDASGNLLVGKTAIGTTVGVEVRPDGYIIATRSASTDAAAFTNAVYSTGASAYRFYVGLGGTVYATNTTISAISDQRLKENVQDIDVGLGAILALKPRKFDWKEGKGKNIKGDRGFIAQEFEQVFPQLVDEWADPAPEGEAPYKSVRQDLIPVLVKAIQELTARVQTLETR